MQPMTGMLPASTDAILVGPNNRVTFDGSFAHFESSLAIDPHNSRHWIAAAIISAGPQPGRATRAYVSFDGGNVWRPFDSFEQEIHGGADPFVTFGEDGTAYFATIVYRAYGSSSLMLYQSPNGGLYWQVPVGFDIPDADHEQMAVDRTASRHHGSLYIAIDYPASASERAKHHYGGRLGFLFSHDNGHRFRFSSVPVTSQSLSTVALNPIVLGNGDILFLYTIALAQRSEKSASLETFGALSSDGGKTFAKPHLVFQDIATFPASSRHNWDNVPQASIAISYPQFTVDVTSSKYHNRVYCFWMRYRDHHAVLAYSGDHGVTWSSPKLVDPTTTRNDAQFQPAVTVNNAGTVGIAWFDTRGVSAGCYNEYFTASIDGGETFLPSKRVSSAPSCPARGNNLTLLNESRAVLEKGQTAIDVHLASPLAGRPNAGDYMGFAADANGIFHPVWPDARNGTWQLWTAAISVPLKHMNQPQVTATNVTSRVHVIFEPGWFDAKTHEYHLPVHIENTSQSPIYAPISAQILATAFSIARSKKIAIDIPSGNTIDFSHGLGDFSDLRPGTMTGAVDVRLHGPLMLKPDLQIRVFGSVSP